MKKHAPAACFFIIGSWFCARDLFPMGYTARIAGDLTQLRRARHEIRAAMLMSRPANDG
jgi:hypothetical protein